MKAPSCCKLVLKNEGHSNINKNFFFKITTAFLTIVGTNFFFVIVAFACPFGWPLQQPAHLSLTTSGTQKLLKPPKIPPPQPLKCSSVHLTGTVAAIDWCVSLNWTGQGSMRNFQSGTVSVLSAVPYHFGNCFPPLERGRLCTRLGRVQMKSRVLKSELKSRKLRQMFASMF